MRESSDSTAATVDRIRRLKQTDETWAVLTRRMRLWVDAKDGSSHRPYGVLVTTADGAKFLAMKLFDEPLTPADVMGQVYKAMLAPKLFSGGKRRPAVIVCDNEELVVVLTPEIAQVGVRCVYRPALPAPERLRLTIETQMLRRPPVPGLLSLPGVTEPLVRRLFALAAEYYRRAPWQFLTDAHPIELRFPADAEPRYAVVMGSGGEVYGLAVYDTAESLDLMYSSLSRKQVMRQTSWLALIFEVARASSFDDLDDLERHGWEVAAPQAYPVFGRTTPKQEIWVPEPADLFWMEGALSGLLKYLPRAGRRARLYPVERTVTVTTLAGPGEVALRVPARPWT